MEERGYIDGTVCPVIPTPVGTGVLIAGGNYNSHRPQLDLRQLALRHHAVLGARAAARRAATREALRHLQPQPHLRQPDGHRAERPSHAHNGVDHWWDDQGVGNCWEDNTYSRGEQTDNFTVPPPACADGGSLFVPGAPVKDAGFLSCSQYDRNDPTLRHPPGVRLVRHPAASAGARRPPPAGTTTRTETTPTPWSPRRSLTFGGPHVAARDRPAATRCAVLRRILVAGVVVAVVAAGGGVAVARQHPHLDRHRTAWRSRARRRAACSRWPTAPSARSATTTAGRCATPSRSPTTAGCRYRAAGLADGPDRPPAVPPAPGSPPDECPRRRVAPSSPCRST